MTKLTQKNESVELWSKSDVSYDHFQKFWKELSQHGRQDLLRVDKQTFLEKIHKNMFCSRCHGFLVEEFSQIVKDKKSSQQDRLGISKSQNVGDSNVACRQGGHQDPSVDPWGCLTTTRDGTLTLLDCYLLSASLKGIQNVFEYSRTSERERKLLYPDACGVGGRRWKGPGTRETCAVHNVWLPLEKLVDFWSSQGEESRQSLFKMKEEDFIELLLFRLDNKKFCKDFRQNVLQEFKNIKELTSVQKESGFQYEISNDTVQADWSDTFLGTDGSYLHFEWGIGTAKGKSDILAFKNVGLTKNVQVKGLDLSGLDACYITIRGWKTEKHCAEFCVKVRTLKGQQYAYCTLVAGDGFVTVTEGESIQNFFKHAEEVLKEDNKLVDENGNRLDVECSRPQRLEKSPELAREFLFDAATVFFKEQVEKAFRERRAHQHAHGVFVSLAVSMLEECAHVAFKNIPTLKNQINLLDEEERKSRKKIKEREKKLRRKERKKNDNNRNNCSPTKQHLAPEVNIEESTIVVVEPDGIETSKIMSSRPVSPHIQDEHRKNMHNSSDVSPDENFASSNDKNGSSGSDQLEYSGWKLNNRYQQDTTSKCSINKQFAVVPGSGIMVDRSDQSYHDDDFDTSSWTKIKQKKHSRSTKSIIRAGNMSKPYSFGNKLTPGDYRHDSHGRPKPKFVAGNIPTSKNSPRTEEVGESTELRMKYIQSFSESDVTVRLPTLSGDAMEPSKPLQTPGALCYGVGGQKTVCIKDKDDVKKVSKSSKPGIGNNGHSGSHLNKETCQYSTEVVDVCSSNSCSSCLSEGNNSGPSSNPQDTEPLLTSKLEDSSQKSDGREASRRLQICVRKSDIVMDKKQIANGGEPIRSCSLDKRRIHTPAEVSKVNGNASPDVSHMYLQAQGIPAKQDPMQTQPIAPGENNLNSNISQAENKGFSFFHYGGPLALADKGFSFFHYGGLLALADAYKSDSLPSEDAVGGLPIIKFIHHNEGDLTSNKKVSIEEYKLFGSEGITFSLSGL